MQLVPPQVARASSAMLWRTRSVLAQTPLLFFAVVLGVGLTFRVAIGWARDATGTTPDVPAVTAAATTTEAGGARGSATSSAATSGTATSGAARAVAVPQRDPDVGSSAAGHGRASPHTRPRGQKRRPPHGG